MKPFPGWYYDEAKQVGVDYANAEEAQSYDLNMQKIRNINEEIEDVKVSLDLDKSDLLLEIGTGTGEFAIEISRFCKRVYAIDVSPVMLKIARKKAKLKNRNNIEFCRGGFLTYCHQGEPINVIVSQLALHHLPDLWKFLALKRVYDLLPGGGRLYLRDVVFPTVDDYFGFINAIIENVKASAGERIAEEVRIHIKEEYSTFDWVMESLLKKAGFNIKKADYFNDFLAVYVCTK